MKDITTFVQRDVDSLWFEGLAAGTSFIAEGCFFPRAERGVRNRHDAAGTLIASNDDSGEFGLSRLTGSVGAGGTMNLGVHYCHAW